MIGYTTLLLDQLPRGTPAHDFAREIDVAAQRAVEVSTKMLALSGRGQVRHAWLDLGDALNYWRHGLQSLAGARARLAVEPARGPCTAQVDPHGVQQALAHLVTNAAEAQIEPDGAIVLAAERVEVTPERLRAARAADRAVPGAYVAVEVRDSGAGMSAETLRRAFDPFFSTRFTGRGLGLPASLGIARGHDGAIEIESAPGRGTTVRLLLPFTASPARSTGGR